MTQLASAGPAARLEQHTNYCSTHGFEAYPVPLRTSLPEVPCHYGTEEPL